MTDLQTYTEQDLAQVEAFLKDPAFPPAFDTWIQDWVATHLINTPASSLLGIPTATFRVASEVLTEESTTSTSFTTLGTAGPQLTGLADGQWVVIWGCQGRCSGSASNSMMGLSINGSTPSDTWAAKMVLSATTSKKSGVSSRKLGAFGAPALDQGDNNSLVAQYRRLTGTGTVYFSKRWLIAIRIGDL